MDGHFVPNIFHSVRNIVKTIRPLTKLFFDVHLMCSKPEILLEPLPRKAGADQIIIHVELGDAVTPLLEDPFAGQKVGLSINHRRTSASSNPYLDKIDHLLVMTVNPGFGGQDFIYETLPKIQQANAWRREKK